MVAIKGGRFTMGSERFYPEERPRKTVEVSSFYIQQHEVTNAQFEVFVKSSGYVTVAERTLDAKQFPQLSEAQRKPGSLVFRQPLKVNGLNDGPGRRGLHGGILMGPTVT